MHRLISFIVQFLLPFLLWTKPVPDIAALGDAGENTRIVGLSTVLTANILLMAPLLFAMRRWRVVRDCDRAVHDPGVLESGMKDMERGWAVVAALVAGLAADTLIARCGSRRSAPGAAHRRRRDAGRALAQLLRDSPVRLRVGWERNVWFSGVSRGLSGVLMNALLVPAQPAVAAADWSLSAADEADEVAGTPRSGSQPEGFQSCRCDSGT